MTKAGKGRGGGGGPSEGHTNIGSWSDFPGEFRIRIRGMKSVPRVAQSSAQQTDGRKLPRLS